jgi:hypothetical protein
VRGFWGLSWGMRRGRWVDLWERGGENLIAWLEEALSYYVQFRGPRWSYALVL